MMKIVKHLGIAAMLVMATSCGEREAANPETATETATDYSEAPATIDTTRDNGFREQMGRYRGRVETRMRELDTEITAARNERRAERDEKRMRRYDERISDRERRREEFRLRLERFETQTENSWEQFRDELDDMFKRDTKNDTLGI